MSATALTIAPDVTLLRGFATPTGLLVHAIEAIAARASFRHLQTPGGGTMSVAMTNCGPWGWHSDTRGYRYVAEDPLTGNRWPEMPERFMDLAARASALGGFPGFAPDACLVNRYVPGAQMGAHRDWDELDKRHPIVSVSIGLPALFLWYGAKRQGKPLVTLVEDGDVVVWGGSARAGYHGVRKLPPGEHPAAGALRYNLTFRRAK
jgi:alkylated DNA repair protein (DNA oxidative demethylase)